MKFGTIINIGIANLCCMTATPGEESVVPNSGPGGSSQICYTVVGSGVTSANGVSLEHSEGSLVDISQFRGRPLKGTAGPSGVTWISVNPFNDETLAYNMLSGPIDTEFTNTEQECCIVVLKGSITVNTANIKELEFCRLDYNKTVTISMQQDTKALVLQK